MLFQSFLWSSPDKELGWGELPEPGSLELRGRRPWLSPLGCRTHRPPALSCGKGQCWFSSSVQGLSIVLLPMGFAWSTLCLWSSNSETQIARSTVCYCPVSVSPQLLQLLQPLSAVLCPFCSELRGLRLSLQPMRAVGKPALWGQNCPEAPNPLQLHRVPILSHCCPEPCCAMGGAEQRQ